MMRAIWCILFAIVPAATFGAPWELLNQAARLITTEEGQEPRVWVDSSGRYKTEAVFVSRNADSVVLRQSDGVVIHVPFARLSSQDQRHLEPAADSNADGGAKSSVITRVVRKINSATPDVSPAASRRQPGADVEALPSDVVYIHVSDRMLRRQISRPVTRQTAVNETIVGTPVSGTAGTTGAISMRLVPSDDRAVVELLFSGQIQSRTTGFGGPVQVHSNGVTQFTAAKRLVLDEQGIEVLPTRVAAQTSTAIQGVSTALPRLRGRIARRIGSQRAAELRPAAEAESARKAETRIAREFDRDVNGELVRANSKLAQMLSALKIDGDALSRLQFATSGDYLRLAIHRDGGEISPVRPPSPATFGSPDLVIHVRGSAVDHAVGNAELQRRLQPLVNMLLADKAPHLVGIVATEPQFQVKQSADGQWWSLVLGDTTSAFARFASRPRTAGTREVQLAADR